MQFVCAQVVNNECLQWIEFVPAPNFITELSMLTYADANQLLSFTVANFACAWVYRHLSKTAYRH
jgi:hypothetical protein